MRSNTLKSGACIPALSTLLFVILWCGYPLRAGSQDHATISETTNNLSRQAWQLGGFAAGGFAPGYTVNPPLLRYQEKLQFYNAGIEAGRTVTAVRGPTFLRGRGEVVVEVTPYWQVKHPSQQVSIYLPGSNMPSFLSDLSNYSIHGTSVVPLQFRWNFMKKTTSRFVPWVQPGFGLLWTNQDFPQGYGDPSKPPIVRTSHINFSPQLDFGETIFVHAKESVSIGGQILHLTNLGLTSYNPGVSILEFRVSYSWWW